jgi:hypothetical protein
MSISRGADIKGSLTIIGSAWETVLVRGHAPASEVTIPMQANGTYVYVGALKPTETPDFVGGVSTSFYRVCSVTTRTRLGRPARAEDKPTLLATFAKLKAAGRDIGGGVMPPRVVNFDAGLDERDINKVDEALRSEIELIIAHEVAHLWNFRSASSHGGAR